MKIETYKEVYHNLMNHSTVPKALQNKPFEVFFVPIIEDNLPKEKPKNMPNPLLKGVGVMHDDLIAPTTDIDDWELD